MKHVTVFARGAFLLTLSLAGLNGDFAAAAGTIKSSSIAALNSAVIAATPATPVITSFTAGASSILPGASTTLTAVFANGTGFITPGNIIVTSGTPVTVTPPYTTKYTLIIINSAGVSRSANTSVGVAPATPVITSFTAGASSILSGASTTLTAVFANGTGFITPGNIGVTSGTPVTVTPPYTTKYTLTIINSAGVSRSTTASVGVAPATPVITSFTASASSILLGASTTLTAVFANGTGFITPGDIVVTSGTPVTVKPADTTTYTLVVVNAAGVFRISPAVISIATGAQSITFANPGAQTVGTPLALKATASSGLAVSFASTTTSVCTVSGATATFVAAGTCTIQATQAGNATYVAATPVSQSFAVSASVSKSQSITFANPGTQTVGTPLTLSATASSGLAVSFASTTTSVCTVSGTTATFVAAGTCTIQATQTGNSTYAAATPVSQSFTVNVATPVPVTSITIPSAATVAAGATATISPTVLPANATNKTLTWNSSDISTAMVSSAGVITGVKQGSVTVTATATDGSGVVSNDCTVTVTAGTSTQSNYFGINIGSTADYETNRMFADVMKSSRAWGTASDAGATLPTTALDANGWPAQDASLYVWAGIDRMEGTYALSFNGQATVAPSSGTIANQSYNSSTNLTTATLTYTASDSNYLTLSFTNTKRTSSSSTNSGITNVVLMRPSAVGSATPLPSTQVFNPPFLTALNDFGVLRTMDFSATNGNEIVHWSDRTRPGDASQAIGNPGVPAGGWEGPGGAWEYAILLANQTSKDLWINVPLNADDDYITKLAQLTKYGSDGTTPYTSAQASPVWPGLNSNVHLYVEFSNEVWNTAGAFAGTEDHAEAVAEVNAGGSPLNFDGDTNDWDWAWRRTAEKTVHTSNIFRSVWGDAAMMTTVRPVLESQLGYADGPLLQAMHLMVDYYDNPAEVSSPHPPSYYIYGLGGSGYYNPTDKSSVNSIFSTMGSGFASAVQGDVDYALPFGVHRIAYEGGPSLDSTGNSTQDANQAAAWADPRMEQVIVTEQNAWSQANGDLLVYFFVAGDYQWGFMSDVLSPTSPKMSGIADILASPRSASTYGTPIPATLMASNAKVPPAWLWSDSSNNSMHDHKWTGFSVLVSTQGAFTVSLTANSATANAEAEIFVDGNSIGTVTVSGSGNTAALSTPTLSVGSHGIMVRSLACTFNMTQVNVQAQ